jgi:hypothetical protein
VRGGAAHAKSSIAAKAPQGGYMTKLQKFIAGLRKPEIREWHKRADMIREARTKPGAHTAKLIEAQRRFVRAALERGAL